MLEKLKGLWVEEEGQAMVEYGLIIALIAVVVIAAVTLIGNNLNTKFNKVGTDIGNAGGSSGSGT